MPFDGTQVQPHVLVLMKAREFLSDEGNWCKGAFVREHQRCAMVALVKAVAPYDSEVVIRACDFLRKALPVHLRKDIAEFNDTHTHAEVLELFDKAIAKATGETDNAV